MARDATLILRLTDDEKSALRAAALRAGVSVSELVREDRAKLEAIRDELDRYLESKGDPRRTILEIVRTVGGET